MAGSDNQLFFTRLLTHVLGNSPPSHTMHAMESLLSPSPSWFTTIVYKPFWLLQVIRAATPFIVRNKDVVVKPCIWNFFSALRSSLETSNLKIGSAGFCWGGKYTILFIPRSKPDRPRLRSLSGQDEVPRGVGRSEKAAECGDRGCGYWDQDRYGEGCQGFCWRRWRICLVN